MIINHMFESKRLFFFFLLVFPFFFYIFGLLFVSVCDSRIDACMVFFTDNKTRFLMYKRISLLCFVYK